jgi:hypothetical protein
VIQSNFRALFDHTEDITLETCKITKNGLNTGPSRPHVQMKKKKKTTIKTDSWQYDTKFSVNGWRRGQVL